jgi:hypothetical protein
MPAPGRRDKMLLMGTLNKPGEKELSVLTHRAVPSAVRQMIKMSEVLIEKQYALLETGSKKMRAGEKKVEWSIFEEDKTKLYF